MEILGKNKGFTLLELLVVIAIIGVLSTIIVVSVNSARAKARDAKRITDFKAISTALELFYDQVGQYPISSGGPTWDDHWTYFSNCLKSGTTCGVTMPPGYVPVMTSVPQDSLDDLATQSDSDPTYYTGWEGRTGQNYILRARLEAGNSVLASDADGGWRTAVDGGCNDPWYCIKFNWPW
ncbi:MAG: prepilin-type N-terminal cleavage/methylation domain-containing protein [Candidatus Portnoybacteria bacterium]|nr:prepilin-type N-terminal cleavage/methylation domain-containing protein [Candidatus Portnoybacteria bacterium]